MRTPFKRISLIAAALLTPAALLTATTAPAHSVTTEKIEILDINIGGQPVYGAGLYSNGLGPVGSLLRMMQDKPGLDGVTVQEICAGQAAWLSSYTGWQYAYSEMTTNLENGNNNCAGDSKGQAIFTPHGKEWEGSIDLGTWGVQTGKDFRGLCIASSQPGFWTETLLICTSHLWADGLWDSNGDGVGDTAYTQAENQSVRWKQAQAMYNWVNGSTAPTTEHKVIWGGDFNSVPLTAAIDQVHRVNRDNTVGTKSFWEVDQWRNCGSASGVCRNTGRYTDNSRKIDYLFASKDGLAKDSSGVTANLVTTVAGGGGDPHDYGLHGTFTYTNVH